MVKYHVKADGGTGICSASEGNCPFTAAGAQHFDDKSEAYSYAQAVIAKNMEGPFATAVHKRDESPSATIQDAPLSVYQNNPTANYPQDEPHIGTMWESAENLNKILQKNKPAAGKISALLIWDENPATILRSADGTTTETTQVHFTHEGKTFWGVYRYQQSSARFSYGSQTKHSEVRKKFLISRRCTFYETPEEAYAAYKIAAGNAYNEKGELIYEHRTVAVERTALQIQEHQQKSRIARLLSTFRKDSLLPISPLISSDPKAYLHKWSYVPGRYKNFDRYLKPGQHFTYEGNIYQFDTVDFIQADGISQAHTKLKARKISTGLPTIIDIPVGKEKFIATLDPGSKGNSL